MQQEAFLVEVASQCTEVRAGIKDLEKGGGGASALYTESHIPSMTSGSDLPAIWHTQIFTSSRPGFRS